MARVMANCVGQKDQQTCLHLEIASAFFEMAIRSFEIANPFFEMASLFC